MSGDLRWSDLEKASPALAVRARDRLIGPGVVLVATIRADGTPRVSPVEPLILDGDLWLSMLWRSRKAGDLRRDPRVLLHSVVTGPEGTDGEVKLRGRVEEVDDLDARARYCQAVQVLGWRPEEPNFHLFRVAICDIVSIRYEPNGDQRLTHWPEGVEFVRRATSATSLGPPESSKDLLTGGEI